MPVEFLSDDQAAILQTVVPDIGELLGRDLPAIPSLQMQAAQERLLTVITTLFVTQKQRVVLILEDLHWEADGIALVRHRRTMSSSTCPQSPTIGTSTLTFLLIDDGSMSM